jgi:hypothetical protein
MNIIKQLFCKHDWQDDGMAPPITFLGVALWSQYKKKCAKCDAMKIVNANGKRF